MIDKDAPLFVLMVRVVGRDRWHLRSPYHIYKTRERAVARATAMSGGRVEYAVAEYRRVGAGLVQAGLVQEVRDAGTGK